MGYEDHRPMMRRGSMTPAEERERRASIKAIMADPNLDPLEKRRSIQHLMDGRRNSLQSGSVHSNTGSVTSNSSNGMGYEDMGYGDKPEASPVLPPVVPKCSEETKRMESSRPPCSHYIRNCTIIAACCGAPFGCRICHDDCPVLPPKIESKQGRRYNRSSSLPSSFTNMGSMTPEDTHHNIDRFAIREVICRNCYTLQSSKT